MSITTRRTLLNTLISHYRPAPVRRQSQAHAFALFKTHFAIGLHPQLQAPANGDTIIYLIT